MDYSTGAEVLSFVLFLLIICHAECRTTKITHEYDVRLVGGDRPSSGRVEIFDATEWVTVCDTNWGSDEARVVCVALGYHGVNAVAKQDAYFGRGTGHVIQMYCYSNDNSLEDCHVDYTWSCDHGNDAGVECDGSVQLRLADGATSNEGRVEMYRNDEWVSACSNRWDSHEAAVVCRQLGYSTVNARVVESSTFGQRSGSVLITNVNCIGSESRLDQCSYEASTLSTCASYAGVRCNIPTSHLLIGVTSLVVPVILIVIIISTAIVVRRARKNRTYASLVTDPSEFAAVSIHIPVTSDPLGNTDINLTQVLVEDSKTAPSAPMTSDVLYAETAGLHPTTETHNVTESTHGQHDL